MNFSAIKMCNGSFKDTCLESLAAKHTASDNESEFVRTGVYEFRDEAVKFMESHFAETIQSRAKRWQQPWGIDWSYEPMMGKIANIRHPTMDSMTSGETKAIQILTYISSLQRGLKSFQDEDDERIALCMQLATYGISIQIQHSPHVPLPTIESLKKSLDDAKHAETDVIRLRSDPWVMEQLVTQNHQTYRAGRNGIVDLLKIQNGTLHETIHISPAVLRQLQPEIEQLKYNKRVDDEATRRLAKEKEDEERMRFELAVNRRMSELRK